MSDQRYGYTSQSGQAGAIGHYKLTIWDDWNTAARMVGVAEYNRYVGAAENTVSCNNRSRWIRWMGGSADAIGQRVSDRQFEPTTVSTMVETPDSTRLESPIARMEFQAGIT